MSDRWTEITESEYAWEQEALAYLRKHMPDIEPFRAWSNFEFIAASGFINEVDLLVLSRTRLYLVEIKSRPGRLTGDAGTWTWHRERRPLVEDNPRKLANLKAKKLKSLLQPHMIKRKARMPFIDAIVFLSNPATRCELDPSGRSGVHLGHGIKGDIQPNILQVLFERDANGATSPPEARDERAIDPAQARALKYAIGEAGIRRSQRQAQVGDYRLEELLHETDLHQDWLARHVNLERTVRRVRVYPVAPNSTKETRALQQRAAEREFQVLEGIEHPGILKAASYSATERGDCLVFPYDPEAERLDVFLALAEEGFDICARIGLLRAIAEAVQYAHGHHIHHRALSPQTILVSSAADSAPTVKIVDWQTGTSVIGTRTEASTVLGQTLHSGLIGEQQSLLYAAPELRSGHAFDGTALDVYSLGAISYHVFSGEAPAVNLSELERKQQGSSGLRIGSVVDGALESLDFLISTATDPQVTDRPSSVAEFLQYLDAVEDEVTAPTVSSGVPPTEARPGDRLEGGFTIKRRIGSGSTGFALLVERDDGREGVLKIAETPELNERLVREGKTLARLRHQHIVELYDSFEIGGHAALFLAKAGAETKTGTLTLAHRLREEGRLSLDLLQRFGEELLVALVWLERQGVSHRDIKPDNIGIAEGSGKGPLTLVLFDFSLAGVSPENIRAGTVGYLDPFLRLRKPARWDVAAERYSAAVTLHEMATGQLPVWGDGRSDPATSDDEVTLESDQFDPSVRERLIHFFRIALARDVDTRFDNAEEMRSEWYRIFQSIDRTTVTTTAHDEAIDYTALFENASRETPLAQLGLSARLLNALERMGAHTIAELLALKGIRLYRNQGIGQKVVREIRELSRQVPDRLRIADIELPSGTAVRGKESIEPAVADEHWSIDRLAAQLVSARLAKQDQNILNAALGLAGIGNAFLDPAEVADSLNIASAVVRQTFSAARERWVDSRWMTPLREDVVALVRTHIGVMTIEELAAGLLATRGSLLAGTSRQRAATAVARAAIEAESVREGSRIELFRDGDRVLVVATASPDDGFAASVEARARYALELGKVCDEIAVEEPLVAPDRVVERLDQVGAPTGDMPMPIDRQRRLGVAASKSAALSSRLEVYPQGMGAERALRLGAGSLLGPKELSCENIVTRIASRYPEAGPLPTVPSKLKTLLQDANVGLLWNGQMFERQRGKLSRFTASTLHRSELDGTEIGDAKSEALIAAEALDKTLHAAMEQGRFLVLATAPRLCARVAKRLVQRFELEEFSLERELVNALQAEVKDIGAQWDVVLKADGAPRDSLDWGRLISVVRRAVVPVQTRLTGSQRPQLLLHTGLLARYGQLSLLTELQERAESNELTPTRFLLLPMDEQVGMPMIDSTPFPVTLASRFVRVGRQWLDLNEASIATTPKQQRHTHDVG